MEGKWFLVTDVIIRSLLDPGLEGTHGVRSCYINALIESSQHIAECIEFLIGRR